MGEHGGLLQRVRDALAVTSAVREVNMFGGRAFMMNEKMLVSVGRDGDLLLRVDPERSEELLAVAGARQAEMGAERSMGKGWITVAEQAVATSCPSKLIILRPSALPHGGTDRVPGGPWRLSA